MLHGKDGLEMLKVNSVILGTKQVKTMVAFYEGLIGKPPDMSDSKEGYYGWQAGGVFFSVLEHSEMLGKTKDPGRVMLNFETAQVKEEFERIKKLGATVVKAPYQFGNGWVATLADPDGNYFQLVTPM
jgi:predicted enzyme related to lactoylglutathione lyase